jgi:hypothetical protein
MVVNIPAKSINYLIGFIWVFNLGIYSNIRKNHRENNLKEEIYEQVKHDIKTGSIKYKYF